MTPDSPDFLEASGGDLPAPRCPTCARNLGYCALTSGNFNIVWYTNDGVLGGVKCPGYHARTAGDAK